MPDNQGEQGPRQNCGQWTLAFAGIIVFGLLFLYQSADMSSSRLLPVQDVVFKAAKLRTNARKHKERWGGDLTNMEDVKRLVEEARDKWIEQLKADYGEGNYYNMFEVNGTSRGRKAFISAHNETGVSIERFKRKLKMKILAMQAAIRAERKSIKESRLRSLEQENDYPDYYERFVWATGGHSASAGHGNLFNESYTAVMERGVANMFGAIGIEFEGRNHAMGGTASAPEIALCSEAVFGTDPDVISWDYGMTDGKAFFRKAMYNQRIGLNPNRPAIIDLNGGDKDRTLINQHVEDRGLTSIYLDPAEMKDIEAMIPDTFGLSKAQVEAMPRYIRHYKCQDEVEKGEPTCWEYKYTTKDICPIRKGTVSWHPGWKRQALVGNMVALFLSDMLLDSISELGTSVTNQTDLLAQLRNEEDAEYEKFFESFAPDDVEYSMVPLDKDLVDSSNVSVFFRSPSFCHTTRLPAQTRHLGILTMSNKVGVHDYEYFKGISMEEANKITNGNDSLSTMHMPLVYEEDPRQKCDDAELDRDILSYFLVTSQMRAGILTIPNDAERQAYGRESEKPQGIVVLCLASCPWGKCKKNEVRLDELVNGTIRIDINDQPVTSVTDFKDCSVLRGKNGHRFRANDSGQYVLKASVSSDDNSTLSFIRISSMVVL